MTHPNLRYVLSLCCGIALLTGCPGGDDSSTDTSGPDDTGTTTGMSTVTNPTVTVTDTNPMTSSSDTGTTTVDPDTTEWAKVALQRMLDITQGNPVEAVRDPATDTRPLPV